MGQFDRKKNHHCRKTDTSKKPINVGIYVHIYVHMYHFAEYFS